MAKVSNKLAKKLGPTYNKHNKRIQKKQIRDNKWLLRADYAIVLKTERALLEDSRKLPNRGGIPADRVEDLQKAFKHRKVPFTRGEINRDEKRRHDALDFMFQCRETAGVPVEDKSKYDGEKARVYSIALIAEIKSGKYSRNKPPVNQGEGKDMAAQKGDGKIEEQQAVPASAGDLEDIDDEDGGDEVSELEVQVMSPEPEDGRSRIYEQEEVYVMSPKRERVQPEPVAP